MTDKLQARIDNQRLVQIPDGTPKQKIEYLLDRPDAEGIVKAVDAPVIYNLIQEAGWDEATALIPYISATQLQVCLDLDCWSRESFSVDAMEPWMEAVLAETNDVTFVRMTRDLDPEVMALLFKTHLKVGVFDEEGDVPEEFMNEPIVDRSPDGVYALVYPEDDRTAALIRGVLRRLFELDRVLAWTLLEACRWELISPMEHEALRWRNSRLEEYGYVTRDEAFEIYKTLPPNRLRDEVESGEYDGKLDIELRPSNVPVVSSVNESQRFFFFQVLDQLDDDVAAQRISMEFVGLQNRAAIADGVEPGDSKSAKDVVERTAGYLSLGLSFLSRHDPTAAVRILSTVKLSDIFRSGFTAVWIVSRNANKLRHRPTLSIVRDQKYSLLSSKDAALFNAISRPRPTYEIDGPDVFHEQSQLDRAALEIGTIALKQLWAFSIAGFTPASLVELATKVANSPDEITFDLLLRTSIANFLVGNTFDTPLTSESLGTLTMQVRAAKWGDDPLGYFEEIAGALLVGLPGGMSRIATRWFERELGELHEVVSPITDTTSVEPFSALVLVSNS